MSMALQPYAADPSWLENVLLEIGDAFEIRIAWNKETAILTGALAIAGGLLGGYAGGRMGAVLGTGVGGVTGIGVSTMVSLREVWLEVKEKLKEVLFIILNYLRRIDPVDYVRAFEIIMACSSSRRELVFTILDFIATKLGREVISNIAIAYNGKTGRSQISEIFLNCDDQGHFKFVALCEHLNCLATLDADCTCCSGTSLVWDQVDRCLEMLLD